MNSIFAGETGGRPFRVRWRGYDRAQVEEILGRMASEHQRLQARLAELEAVGARGGADDLRQSESLTALRAAIANHLYTSVGALRKATELLSALPTAPPQAGVDRELVPASSRGTRALRTVAVGAGLAAAVVFLYMRQPAASEISPSPVVIGTTLPADRPVPAPAVEPAATPVTEPVRVAETSDGLVLTLSALQTCWIRAGIDGDEPFERLLDPGATITLRAQDEVVLRVGDAAALSLVINNRSARPLGAVGQVVTVRVTPANYPTLLTDNADLVTNRPAGRSQG